MKQTINYMSITALISSFILIQGCATSMSKLSADGKTDTIIFPNIEKSAWVKEGTFPNVDNLRNVAPNMTKTQLYALLGNPHFAEGFGKVREWDYIFNFRQAGTAETQTCQYKITYNTDMRLKSTHWKPNSCANWLDTLQTQAQSTEKEIIEKIVEKPVPGPVNSP